MEIPKTLFEDYRRNRRSGPKYNKQTSLRIPLESYERMKALNYNHNIKGSNFIRWAIELGLDEIEKRINQKDSPGY